MTKHGLIEDNYSSVLDIITTQKSGVKVRMRGAIVRFQGPHMIRGKDKFKLRASVDLIDCEGEIIRTTKFGKSRYIELRRLQRLGMPIEIDGTVNHCREKGHYKPKIKIRRIRDGSSIFSQCQPSRKEIKLVRKLIKRAIKKKWSLLNEIRKSVIEYIGIVIPEHDRGYRDFLDCLVCQSVSGGKVGKSNGKLHTLAIGRPGTGKSLLSLSCKSLNFNYQEAQIQRTNVIGLVGNMNNKHGSWKVTPGLIPMGHNGALAIQDFDKIEKKESIFNPLNSTMEEGCVTVTGAARVTLPAITAIHLDLNRQSDLNDDNMGMKGSISDIGLPSNIISRIDYIGELKEDSTSQLEKGQKIIEALSTGDRVLKSRIGKYCQKNGIELERFLPLLTAYIFHKYTEIDCRSVNRKIQKRLAKIYNKYDDEIRKNPALKGYLGRLPNSVHKFVTSLTRLQLRQKANSKSVKEAFYYVNNKLDFLMGLNPSVISNSPASKKSQFQRWLRSKSQSKSFSIREVITKYKKDGSPCGQKGDSTLMKWIKEIACQEAHGKWRLQ